MASVRTIGLSSPWLDEREEELVADVLRSGRLSLGPTIDRFEEAFAEAVGAPYAAAVSSGTAGLHLLCVAAGVGPGDEVVTPAFSFVASASTIVMAGAQPVFVDIDPATFALDPDALESALTRRTRAIIVVHLYGHPGAIDRIAEIARRRGVPLIEDAAQAIGATWDGRPIGGWGDVACLSFYPTKNLGACGDAGMLLTNRDDVAEHVRRLRHHGDTGRYHHVELGYCSRLDEMQAAMLRVKLRRLEAWNVARRQLATRYRARLAGLPLGLPAEHPRAQAIYHQFVVRHPQRDALAKVLADLGVGTMVHYPLPVPGQPLFGLEGEKRWPQAWRAAREVLSLPCYPEMTDAEIEGVAAAVRTALDRV